MATIKLAEALLRRKELQDKVVQLKSVKEDHIFRVAVNRKNVTDNIDEIVTKTPLVSITEVTKAYDWHARRLREVDAVIQQANWVTDVDVPDVVVGDYESGEIYDNRLDL